MQLDQKRLSMLRLIKDGTPSLKDLALAAGLSRPGAQSAVRGLERDGYITKEPGKQRSLKITEKGNEALTQQAV